MNLTRRHVAQPVAPCVTLTHNRNKAYDQCRQKSKRRHMATRDRKACRDKIIPSLLASNFGRQAENSITYDGCIFIHPNVQSLHACGEQAVGAFCENAARAAPAQDGSFRRYIR